MVQRLLSSNGINGNTVMPEQNSKKLASTLLQPRESKYNQSRGGDIRSINVHAGKYVFITL